MSKADSSGIISAQGTKLQEVHARLFAEDVTTIKQKSAQSGLPWHIELRLLVRRALKREQREPFILKEKP